MEPTYYLIQYRFTRGQQMGILIGVSLIGFMLLYGAIILVNKEWGFEFQYGALAALLFFGLEYGLVKFLMQIKKTGLIVFKDSKLAVQSFLETDQLSIPYKQIKTIEIIRGIRKDIFIKNNQYISSHVIFLLNNNQEIRIHIENAGTPQLLETIYRITEENRIELKI